MKKHLFFTFALFLFQLVSFAQIDIAISNEKPDKKLFVTSDSSLGIILNDGSLELFINENAKQVQKWIIVSFEIGYQKDGDFQLYSINGNKITVDLLNFIMGKKSIEGDIYIYEIIVRNAETGRTKTFFNKIIKVSFPNH